MTHAPVAIVVVSWNTRELLRACLSSLAGEAESGHAKVWVVDNASEDGSAELARREFPWAQVIACRENLGFGAAANLGAAQSSSPWIAIANADTELTPGALDALVAAGERDPRAGILAPRLVLPSGETQHSVYAFPTLALTLAFNLGLLSRARADHFAVIGKWNPDRPREVDWTIGAFIVVRREAWEAVGGFDAAQWMFAEDLDLGWRAAAAGWHTRYEPAAVVRHVGGAATAQRFPGRGEDPWLRSTYAWLLRRRGPVLARAIALVSFLGAAARAALLSLPALIARGQWAGRWRHQAHWARLHLGNLVVSRRALERHR